MKFQVMKNASVIHILEDSIVLLDNESTKPPESAIATKARWVSGNRQGMNDIRLTFLEESHIQHKITYAFYSITDN